jgi:NAD(P)-dependent dehydrogenase (short-subunit alcohol dehydrogenase family)
VLSGIRLARHYVHGMRSRNWGRIVFVSSESGLQIPTEMVHYGMTTTAQLAVSRGLAETLTGVTVNSVLPGPTASEGVGEFVTQMAPRVAWIPRRWNGNSSQLLAPPRCCSDSLPRMRSQQ